MKTNGKDGGGLVLEVKCPKCSFVFSYALGKFSRKFSMDQHFDKAPTMLGQVEKGITILSVK